MFFEITICTICLGSIDSLVFLIFSMYALCDMCDIGLHAKHPFLLRTIVLFDYSSIFSFVFALSDSVKILPFSPV